MCIIWDLCHFLTLFTTSLCFLALNFTSQLYFFLFSYLYGPLSIQRSASVTVRISFSFPGCFPESVLLVWSPPASIMSVSRVQSLLKNATTSPNEKCQIQYRLCAHGSCDFCLLICDSSTSSWDVLPSNRPAPMPRSTLTFSFQTSSPVL